MGESFISISYLKKGCKSYASFEVTDISNTSVKNVSDDDNVLNTKESQMYCIPMIQARKSDQKRIIFLFVEELIMFNLKSRKEASGSPFFVFFFFFFLFFFLFSFSFFLFLFPFFFFLFFLFSFFVFVFCFFSSLCFFFFFFFFFYRSSKGKQIRSPLSSRHWYRFIQNCS